MAASASRIIRRIPVSSRTYLRNLSKLKDTPSRLAYNALTPLSNSTSHHHHDNQRQDIVDLGNVATKVKDSRTVRNDFNLNSLSNINSLNNIKGLEVLGSCSNCLLSQRSNFTTSTGLLKLRLNGFHGMQCHYYSTESPQQVQDNHGPTELFGAEFPTIEGTENLLIGMHNLTGLPWWATIIGASIVLRSILPMPLTIYSLINSKRLQRLQPEIRDAAVQLRQEVSLSKKQMGWTQKQAKRELITKLKARMSELYIRDNCHPMKDSATFWIRLPIWISASYALRNMSVKANNPQLGNHDHCASFKSEGLAWFSDLTVVDSTWILPITMGVVTLINVEIGRRMNVTEMTTYRRGLTYFLRGLAVAFVPISSLQPTALVLYWVSSGVCSAFQTLYLDRSPAVLRLAGFKRKPAATSPTTTTSSNSKTLNSQHKSKPS